MQHVSICDFLVFHFYVTWKLFEKQTYMYHNVESVDFDAVTFISAEPKAGPAVLKDLEKGAWSAAEVTSAQPKQKETKAEIGPNRF